MAASARVRSAGTYVVQFGVTGAAGAGREREGEERNRGEREGGKEGGRGKAMHGQRGQT